MKYLFTIVLLFAVLLKVSGQSPIVGQSYKTTVRLSVKPYQNYPTATSQGSKYEVLPGVKFTIIDITADNQYVIQFGNFNDSSKLVSRSGAYVGMVTRNLRSFRSDTSNNIQPLGIDRFRKDSLVISDTTHAFIGFWANYKEFVISANDLSQKCQLFYTHKTDFTFGALTLPLKIRFGNGNNTYSTYEENLNLGLTAGVRLQIPGVKDQNLNFIGMVGVSSVNIDSLSLTNKNLYNSTNPTSKAISFGAGIVYQNSSFQLGFLYGIDHISGIVGRSWKYQDKMWVGIGVGLALYNTNTNKSGSNVNNGGN